MKYFLGDSGEEGENGHHQIYNTFHNIWNKLCFNDAY